MRSFYFITIGLLLFAIGLAFVLAAAATPGSGVRYPIAYGAMVLGVAQVIRGIMLVGEERAEARVTVAEPSRLIRGEILASDYPAEARDAGAEGRVELGYWVDECGQVQQAEVIGSSGCPVLDAAARSLLEHRYIYQPALNGLGEPIAHYRTAAIDWVLEANEDAEEPAELAATSPDRSVPVAAPEEDRPSTRQEYGAGDVDEFAVDADGLNRWDRKWLERDLAKPWSELIWSIRQCEPREPFGLALLQRAYDRWANDPSLDANELDDCRVRLAQALAAVARDDEALELLRVALADREGGKVTKGDTRSLIVLRIAEIEAKIGDPADAIQTVRRALAIQPERHFFYNDRARGYQLLARLLSETGDDAEARVAGQMAEAWYKLASARLLTFRDAPGEGLENAQAARQMMIAAVGNGHGDLRFADRAISEAAADMGS